jgi:2-oxo-4-hydroxy-4-carboxy-5-ureidoimidazoline decarboxylase
VRLTLAELNALPLQDAAAALTACCGSEAWVAGMLARRPFATRAVALSAAGAVAATLTREDWLQAFAHHPRIGDRQAAADVSAMARDWSSREQSVAGVATQDVQAALAEANVAYERRFGFIFIICASGRSGQQILDALRARLRNAPEEEIVNAASEQRQITRLRLARLIHENDGEI